MCVRDVGADGEQIRSPGRNVCDCETIIFSRRKLSLSLSHWFKIEPQSDRGLMHEATPAIELIAMSSNTFFDFTRDIYSICLTKARHT